jgi:hypothetical protein
MTSSHARSAMPANRFLRSQEVPLGHVADRADAIVLRRDSLLLADRFATR